MSCATRQGLSPAIPGYIAQSYLENSAPSGFSICPAKTPSTHKVTGHAIYSHRCRIEGIEPTYTLKCSVLTASLHLIVLSVRLRVSNSFSSWKMRLGLFVSTE